MLSVIVPIYNIYNDEKYITKYLDYILEEDYLEEDGIAPM